MANYRGFENPATTERVTSSAATLNERVYDTLRDEILAGRILPGTRLARRELSKRLGVSPMPITEALLRLERDGLVESRPLVGSRVRPLTMEDVRNDQILREAIECQAARVCAENISEADLARLRTESRMVDRMMAQGDPGSKLGMRAHQDFHFSLARCGGFSGLADELERVWFRRLMRLSWVKATQYRPVPADWHQQLVEAIAARDADRAEVQMRAHVRYGNEDDCQVLEYLLSQASPQYDPPSEPGP